MTELRLLDLAVPKKAMLLAWSDAIQIHCENELAVVEEVVTLKKVPFPRPGIYQFTIKESGEALEGGECYLHVFSGDSQ